MVKKAVWILVIFVVIGGSACRLDLTHAVFARERNALLFLSSRFMNEQTNLSLDGKLDRDGDGVGEFGDLAEILRDAEPRRATWLRRIREFRADLGEAQISDYYLAKIFVPEETDLAEQFWCAVAWPLRYGKGGVKTSFLYCFSAKKGAARPSQLWRCRHRRFSGWGHGPRLSEIFVGEPFQSQVDAGVWK